MLDSLTQTGKKISRELGRAWEELSDGWREIFNRSSGALTHFMRSGEGAEKKSDATPATYPRWGLLAGEVEETENEIVVRLEIPGVEKEDCRVRIEGNMLCLSGEKHSERSADSGAYHVMERAYGSFTRLIPLPRNVIEEEAQASCRNGVLTVRLPKSGSEKRRSIPIS